MQALPIEPVGRDDPARRVQALPTAHKLPLHVIARRLRRGNLVQALPNNKKGLVLSHQPKETLFFFPNNRAHKLPDQPQRTLVRVF